jgi:hypothetical protein
MQTQTVKIVDPDNPTDYQIINIADFDSSVHTLFSDALAKSSRKRKEKPQVPQLESDSLESDPI